MDSKMRITNRYRAKEKYYRFMEKDVISIFLQNNSVHQTASILKISYNVINKILNINGYERPKRNEWRLGTSNLFNKTEKFGGI